MIRTTVVGSYPRIGDRPEEQKLRQTLARRDRKEIPEETLREVEDEVTREVIREQCQSGVDLVTDGQIRWQDPQTYIAGRLGGIRITGLIRFFDTNTYFRQPEVEGPVRWLAPILVRDYRFAVEHSDRPVKAVLTGPLTLAMLSRDRHYRDPERLILDFARALAEETAALEAAGAEWIQIDEPGILWWPDRFDVLERAILLLAQARRKARLALYTYFRGPGRILGRLGELPVDLLGVDLAEGRGDLAAVEHSPPRRTLALGILDGRNTKLEDEGEVAAVVRRLSQASGSREMFVNPSSGLEFLPRDAARRKLDLLRRVADRVNREGA